jgi:hypothetical protein
VNDADGKVLVTDVEHADRAIRPGLLVDGIDLLLRDVGRSRRLALRGHADAERYGDAEDKCGGDESAHREAPFKLTS